MATTVNGTRSGPTSQRWAIASSADYGAAERTVDALADGEFPVEHVAIVGHGLRSHEQVIGRSTWGRAAGTGAIQGSFVGGWFGLIFGLFDAIDTRIGWLALLFWGVVYGAAIGALVGLAVHSLRDRGRDFVSQSGLEAERYEVVVDDGYQDEAARVLGTTVPRRVA
jgi:hypothetical protein